MDQTAKLKAALKAEIRKTIKESQSYDLNWKPEGWSREAYTDGEYRYFDEKGEPRTTEEWKEEWYKHHINKNKPVNELARVATVIKIGNKKAAEAYVLANKGKWVSDMVQAVIDAGDAGITQPALATAIGKGSQQTINPKVREFITAGVFVQGEAGVKTAQPKQEPKAKEKTPKPSKVSPKSDDEDEFTDDFEKSDAEDDAPEDEDTMAAKATPNKGVQTDAKKLDQVLADMKKLAADYKTKKGTPDGDAIVAKLKDLNKEKVKLEKTVHKALGDEDDDLLDTTGDD
jgi:hypothetical protein